MGKLKKRECYNAATGETKWMTPNFYNNKKLMARTGWVLVPLAEAPKSNKNEKQTEVRNVRPSTETPQAPPVVPSVEEKHDPVPVIEPVTELKDEQPETTTDPDKSTTVDNTPVDANGETKTAEPAQTETVENPSDDKPKRGRGRPKKTETA